MKINLTTENYRSGSNKVYKSKGAVEKRALNKSTETHSINKIDETHKINQGVRVTISDKRKKKKKTTSSQKYEALQKFKNNNKN